MEGLRPLFFNSKDMHKYITKDNLEKILVDSGVDTEKAGNVIYEVFHSNKDELDHCREVFDFWNNYGIKTGRAKPGKKNLEMIRARIREGMSVDELKAVVAWKYEEWVYTKLYDYFAIKTIFNTNCNDYLSMAVEKGYMGYESEPYMFYDRNIESSPGENPWSWNDEPIHPIIMAVFEAEKRSREKKNFDAVKRVIPLRRLLREKALPNSEWDKIAKEEGGILQVLMKFSKLLKMYKENLPNKITNLKESIKDA